jgi:small GTP-binding protein
MPESEPRVLLVVEREDRTPPSAIAWAPDGTAFAISGHTGIEIYDFPSGDLRLRVAAAAFVSRVTFDPLGTLVLGAVGSSVHGWSLESGRRLGFQLGESAGAVTAIATAERPDAARVLLHAGGDGNVYLRDLFGSRDALRFAAFSEQVAAVAIAPGGERWAAGNPRPDSQNLVVYRTESDHGAYMSIPGGTQSICFSPDGRTIAVGTPSGSVSVLDVTNGRTLISLEGPVDGVDSLAFTPDGRHLVARSRGIHVWSCSTWRLATVLFDHHARGSWQQRTAAMHPSREVLATTGLDGRLVVFDLNLPSRPVAVTGDLSIRYATKKVALVGDSGVGKSTLGSRLVYDEFILHESTHGQRFWILDAFGEEDQDGTTVEVVLWDFAGQPEYRLVHSLFLDGLDCALLLFDASNQEDPLRGVEFWVRKVRRTDGSMTPAVLVGARADRGTPNLTYGELQRFCTEHGISHGYVSTSAKTREGIEDLKRLTASALAASEPRVTVTSQHFLEVKIAVLRIKEAVEREKSGKPILTVDELIALVDTEEAATVFVSALRALRNHGYVELVSDSRGREFVVLLPDLLVGLASSIVLEARRNPRGLGALREADLLEGRYSFPELDGLSADERRLMLDAVILLFLGRKACLRESLGADALLVFPALINQSRPESRSVPIEEFATYRVTGDVANVFPALVVLLGYTNAFRRSNQWRDHAEYEVGPGEICGFRRSSHADGLVELVIYHSAGSPDSVRMLFQGLFEDFLRRRNVHVLRFPLARCAQCSFAQERSTVVRRVLEGRTFVICEECGSRIQLTAPVELSGHTADDASMVDQEQLTARIRISYQAALVKIKALARDKGIAAPTCFISYAWGLADDARWVEQLAVDLSDAGVNVLLDVWDNSAAGASISRFISEIATADRVIVVGTPSYREKHETRDEAGTMVAAEGDLIGVRMTGGEAAKKTVHPVLLRGLPSESFPPLLQGRVHIDFRDPSRYFGKMLDLVTSVYGMSRREPAVLAARHIIEGGTPV